MLQNATNGVGEQAISLFEPSVPFSFSLPTGNAIHKNKPVQNCISCRKRKTKCDRKVPCTPCVERKEADTCQPHVKEVSDKPTGYTHVSDTSILANRVTQLELVLSRVISRLDNATAYSDLLYGFKGPLPIARPKSGDGKTDGESRFKTGLDRFFGGEESRENSYTDGDMTSLREKTPTVTPRLRKTVTLVEPDLSPKPSISGAGHVSGAAAAGSSHANQALMTMPSLGDLGASNPIELDLSGPSNDLTFDPSVVVPDLSLLEAAASWPEAHEFVHSGDAGLEPLTEARLQQLPHTMNSEPYSKAPSAQEHDAALALESIALGRSFGVDEIQEKLAPENPESGPSPSSPLTFTSYINQRRTPQTSSVRKPFPEVQNLPSLIVGKYVLAQYLNDEDFMWRCLHKPRFQRQYDELCVRLRSKSPDFTLNELSTLALYAACLAVGFHFLTEDDYRDLGIDETQAVRMAENCWAVSQKALEAADWMQVANIKNCQAVIIAGLYLSSVRRADHHWTLLGVATKIALSLQLSDIPDETLILGSGSVDGMPPRWRSSIDREEGRRVWYCLLEHDWLFSMERNFSYTIAPEMSRTTEPANINDADIQDDKPVVSAPKDTHTEMSYFLWRLQILYPLQTLVSKYRSSGRMHYSFVVEAHEGIQQAFRSRPAFYQSTDSLDAIFDASQLNQIKREATSFEEACNLRTLRVHRAYFPASCQNPRYSLTKKACLQSSRQLLGTRRQGSTLLGQVSSHYWALAYSTFLATTIIIIYLNYALQPELEELERLAQTGIDRLTELSGSSRTDLGDTAEKLQALMRVQLGRRAEAKLLIANDNPLKRTFEDFKADAWIDHFLEPLVSSNRQPDVPSTSRQATETPLFTDDLNIDLFLESWLNDASNPGVTPAV